MAADKIIESDKSLTATVNKIIPFSCVDGPGNRTAIFFQGCNIDCKYCHNPETRAMVGDPDITSTREMMVSEVIDSVQKQIPFIRGITVSGGECMLRWEFVTELFARAKELGLTTLIDTNGTIPFMGKDDLLSVTDGVMLDVKAYEEADHIKLTGASNRVVLENLDFLARSGKLFEIRCVIVPRFYNGMNSVMAIADRVKGCHDSDLAAGHKTFHFKLIKYRLMGVRTEYRDTPSPSDKYLEMIEEKLKEKGFYDTVIS